MKLSQFDLIQTPTGNTTKTVNKGEFFYYHYLELFKIDVWNVLEI